MLGAEGHHVPFQQGGPVGSGAADAGREPGAGVLGGGVRGRRPGAGRLPERAKGQAARVGPLVLAAAFAGIGPSLLAGSTSGALLMTLLGVGGLGFGFAFAATALAAAVAAYLSTRPERGWATGEPIAEAAAAVPRRQADALVGGGAGLRTGSGQGSASARME